MDEMSVRLDDGTNLGKDQKIIIIIIIKKLKVSKKN